MDKVVLELIEEHGDRRVETAGWIMAAHLPDKALAEAVEYALAADGAFGLVDLAEAEVIGKEHVGELVERLEARAAWEAVAQAA